MTFPREWVPGERITAQRLNEMRDAALSPRREVSLGNGSSLVNEALANQSANMQRRGLRLAIANENFDIPAASTDLVAAAIDEAPSASCSLIRLNRANGRYEEETLCLPFRAYDVLAALESAAYKSAGDVFYVGYNEDTKRWEVITSAGITIQTAKVRTCLGQGWYVVDFCDWNGAPYGDSLSESVDDLCDLCDEIEGYSASANVQECETVSSVLVDREVCENIGQAAYAHTCGLLPLLIGGMVKMIRRGAGGSDSLSLSVSASESIDETRLFDIIDPCRPLVSLPFPVYECCVAEDGSKSVQVVGCNHVIVEGVICDGGETTCAAILGESGSV